MEFPANKKTKGPRRKQDRIILHFVSSTFPPDPTDWGPTDGDGLTLRSSPPPVRPGL